MLWSDTRMYKNMTTSRKRKTGKDSDVILPLLEENEDSVVTEGRVSDNVVMKL